MVQDLDRDTSDAADAVPRALVGWRLLALAYDFWPALALWMLVGAAFTLGFWLAGHPPRENIAPFSGLQWIEWGCLWIVTGAYAVLSWRGGGQTLGMRPWRLRLVSAGLARPTWRALGVRYLVGTASLLLAGAGFWWAWFDRDGITWHDRASGTRMTRMPKLPRT